MCMYIYIYIHKVLYPECITLGETHLESQLYQFYQCYIPFNFICPLVLNSVWCLIFPAVRRCALLLYHIKGHQQLAGKVWAVWAMAPTTIGTEAWRMVVETWTIGKLGFTLRLGGCNWFNHQNWWFLLKRKRFSMLEMAVLHDIYKCLGWWLLINVTSEHFPTSVEIDRWCKNKHGTKLGTPGRTDLVLVPIHHQVLGVIVFRFVQSGIPKRPFQCRKMLIILSSACQGVCREKFWDKSVFL